MIGTAGRAWNVRVWILSNPFTPARSAACRIFSCLFVSKWGRLSVRVIGAFKLPPSSQKTSLKASRISYVEEIMPVRNPLKQAGRTSFAVASRKLDREIPMVHCDGPNERD